MYQLQYEQLIFQSEIHRPSLCFLRFLWLEIELDDFMFFFAPLLLTRTEGVVIVFVLAMVVSTHGDSIGL